MSWRIPSEKAWKFGRSAKRCIPRDNCWEIPRRQANSLGCTWVQKQGHLSGDDWVNRLVIQEGKNQEDFKDPNQGNLLELLQVESWGLLMGILQAEKQENVKESMQEDFLDFFWWTILECPSMW